MTTRAICALSALVGLARSTEAQEDVSYSIAYGLATLHPGEAQTISVSATMAPGIGSPAMVYFMGNFQTGTVYAFEASIWDIVNGGNGDTGTFSNAQVEPSLNAANIPGHASAGGNWVYINDGQLVFPPTIPGDQRNPIPLFTIDWTPADYTPRTVTFNTRLYNSNSMNMVYVDVGALAPIGDPWTSSFGQASFNIVPVPGGPALIGLCGMLACRRRRTRTEIARLALA